MIAMDRFIAPLAQRKRGFTANRWQGKPAKELFVYQTVAKNHKRQRRKRQSVTAKREKSQTPKILTAILTLLNLT